MMQKAVVHEPSGKILKFGRHRPTHEHHSRRLYASKYLQHKKLGKAPDSLASSALAQPCMDRMLMNDELSCCTTAATMKCSAQVNGDAGIKIIYDNDEAKAFYAGSTGWDGTPVTDQGGNEEDVIDYCTKYGIEKNLHHWAGKLSVDGANPEEVKHIVGITKNLMFGVELAAAWLQLPTGSVLTVAGGPDEEDGHAFPSGGVKGFYVPEGVVVTLWGGIEQLMPWDVLKKFTANAEGGELHSMVSRDALRAGVATTSSGFNWQQYSEDFTSAGGTLA